MTLEQFKAAQRASWKLEWITVLIFFAAIIVAASVGTPLARHVEEHGLDLPTLLLLLVAVVVIGIPTAYCLGPWHSRKIRQLGLLCPHCQKPLIGHMSSQVVVATGNCGFCGGRVLD